jgi:hypothetical protein
MERMNVRLLSLLVLPLVVAVAAVTIAAPDARAQTPTTLSAALFGREEVPGPGDPDGFGGARVTLNPMTDQVCVSIGVLRIEPATMAHIHRGAVGVEGPVVVHLTSLIIPAAAIPGLGSSAVQGCVAADSALIDEIIANPAGFYVNVHNGPFPKGAVRGQLR